MPYFPQQQQPSPFKADEIEQKIDHPAVGPVLAVVGGVGMGVYGLDHPGLPLVVYIMAGIIVGMLAVKLVKHVAIVLIIAAMMAVAGLGTYWLLINETTLRQRHAAPAAQTTPTSLAKPSAHSLLDDLRKAVQ